MELFGWKSFVFVYFFCYVGGRNSEIVIYGLKWFKIVVLCGIVGGKNFKINKKGKYYGDFDCRDYIV